MKIQYQLQLPQTLNLRSKMITNLLQKETAVEPKNIFGLKHYKYLPFYLESRDVYLPLASHNKEKRESDNTIR